MADDCDGNLITGAGVTAGIDSALTVSAEIAGADHAQAVQPAMEYAPEAIRRWTTGERPCGNRGRGARALRRRVAERRAAAERAAQAVARDFAQAQRV